ncbi:hypothetical protein AAGW05_13025 [Arthrobacter sp. LAPM80]|uniref:hypothetical protein n=1 Tax=Arthrobacter sp. LAPM80 TaxID=3141788 RepID=UPI00398AB63A
MAFHQRTLEEVIPDVVSGVPINSSIRVAMVLQWSQALVELLGRHTGTPEESFFAL